MITTNSVIGRYQYRKMSSERRSISTTQVKTVGRRPKRTVLTESGLTTKLEANDRYYILKFSTFYLKTHKPGKYRNGFH